MKLVLASQSPRRQELLWNLGLHFRLELPDVDEVFPDDMPVRMVPSFLSEKKARAAANYLKFDELLLAADTIVLFENRIFGKPSDASEAKQMLRMLSGNMHEVITGVTLKTREKEKTFSELTRVYFRMLREDFIDYYVEKYQPLDKAGAYGIQDFIGYVGIEKVNGCFYNVMGLPLSRTVKELAAFGFEVMPVKESV
jgi:septum formation protein